ncbi:unnamed protein product [Protopolystoma xenopodis]|uniref:mitogen-activated protein kinase kinase n=1 Tax=Protopolystoma xenopodis TaxID=117903 RepID=A0A448X5S2_9PLAT|nr:unnamed protein product [Protopolystoma xenopodis]
MSYNTVCDFGISAELVDSLAQSNVGTQNYLAPERISPRERSGYRIQSDVWSLGLSVLEMAIGEHPYPKTVDFFHQLDQVHGNRVCKEILRDEPLVLRVS